MLNDKNLKKSKSQNLKRLFVAFKKGCFKAISSNVKTGKSIRKITQNIRILDLVSSFRTNLIQRNLSDNKKKEFLFKFRNNLIQNKERRLRNIICKTLSTKKFEVKWKWTIFNVLFKHMIMSRCNKSL